LSFQNFDKNKNIGEHSIGYRPYNLSTKIFGGREIAQEGCEILPKVSPGLEKVSPKLVGKFLQFFSKLHPNRYTNCNAPSFICSAGYHIKRLNHSLVVATVVYNILQQLLLPQTARNYVVCLVFFYIIGHNYTIRLSHLFSTFSH